MTEFALIGAGGLGVEVAAVSALSTDRQRIVGVVDDDPAAARAHFSGVEYWGTVEEFLARPRVSHVHLAIGNNRARQLLDGRCDSAGLTSLTVMHPWVHVGKDVTVGAGSYLAPFVIVSPTATIERHVILNSHAAVGHHTRLASYAQIGPGGKVSGHCAVGEGAMVASNGVLLPGVHLGAGSIVGAGSVATRDVPDDETVFGVPARRIPR